MYEYILKIFFNKNIIYYLKIYFNNLKTILDKGSIGGLFEILVLYNIFKNKKLCDVNIDEFLSINSLVPNQYSIKNHSYLKRLKNKFKNSFDLLSITKSSNEKIELKENVYGIFQNNFNSKYFDFAIIIRNGNENNFILKLIQITTHKDKKNLYEKEEIELMSFFVKNNIEFHFNINIIQADFYYIFSAIEGNIIDKVSYDYAKKKGFGVIPFCLKEMEFPKELIVNNDNNKAMITKKFPIHNKISLIKDESNEFFFKIENKIKQGEFSSIDNDLFMIFNNFFDKTKLMKNQILKISDLPNNSNDFYSYLTDFSFVYCVRKENVDNKFIIFFNGKAYNALNRVEINEKVTHRNKTTLFCSMKPLLF